MTAAAAPPGRGTWYWAAEVGVLGLGLALAVSTTRLFVGARPMLVLVGVAVLAWALAALLPRTPLPAGAAEGLHLLIGLGIALLAVGRATLWYGLPTAATFGHLGDVVRHDFASFSSTVAPVEAGAGHVLVMGAAIWLLALFASGAAMRLRSPVQGAVPHTLSILALGIVARLPGRVPATVALLGALAVYALTQAAWRNAALRWIPRQQRGIAAPLAGGAAVLALCGVVSLTLSPVVPGDSRPVVDLRQGNGNSGPRSVVSPFVEVGSNLGPRSNQLLFTVTSPVAAYWRLTALDEYDSKAGIWVLANSYDVVDGPLRDPHGDRLFDTEVRIDGLGGFWIPTAPDPVRASSSIPLSFDATSGSLIARGQDVATGDAIEVTGAAPLTDKQRLESADVPRRVDRVLVDDSGIPASLTVTAARVAGTLAPYEQALALQEYFRTEFRYDDTVDFSRAADPLEAFLQERRGFCQQFSTAFALAARSLGLPARVVVGFTPGDQKAGASGVASFEVRGRHAHAWPEVLFDGIGWVPFEPTPGRGDPSTTAVTGVNGAQAAPDGSADPIGQPATTAPPTTSATGRSPSSSVPREQSVTAGARPNDTTAGRPARHTSLLLGGLVVLAAAALAASALVRRRRRAARDPGPADAVAGAWLQTVRRLDALGLHPDPWETPCEFALRASDRLGRLPRGGDLSPSGDVSDAIGELAVLESGRRWSPVPLRADEVEAAMAAARRVAAALAADDRDLQPA